MAGISSRFLHPRRKPALHTRTRRCDGSCDATVGEPLGRRHPTTARKGDSAGRPGSGVHAGVFNSFPNCRQSPAIRPGNTGCRCRHGPAAALLLPRLCPFSESRRDIPPAWSAHVSVEDSLDADRSSQGQRRPDVH